jgi:hypothetical protein
MNEAFRGSKSVRKRFYDKEPCAAAGALYPHETLDWLDEVFEYVPAQPHARRW